MAHFGTAVEAGLGLHESTCLRSISNPSLCPLDFKREDSTSGKELCAGTVTHDYKLGDILWIDTDLPNKEEVSLSECPVNLILQGKTFTLRALVSFQGSLSNGGLVHYLQQESSVCVWEFYDDLAKAVNTASTTKCTLVCSLLPFFWIIKH